MTPPRGRHHAIAVVVLALALVALAPAVLSWRASAQSGAAVTLAEYEGRLGQARARIAEAQGADSASAVEQAAGDLGAIDAVLLPDGTQFTLEPLIARDDSQERALAAIDVVLTQLHGASSDNSAERLASLDSVLARDAFHPERGLLGWLRRLLEGPEEPATSPMEDAANAGARGLNILLTVVGALVAILILGRIIQALLGNFVSEAELRQGHGRGDAPATVAAVRKRAADLAESGSYREAVRQLYLAILLGLEDHGLLRLDRSLTNREVLTSVGHRQEVQQGLRPVVDVFERVWYGEREPDREAFERYLVAVDRAAGLIEAAEAATPAGPAITEAG